eukprot:TRINITY_DN6444_c0_g1_i1.p1 TRINITY_DN6444_c0_g1~~TRINITY_DN6444_c0_g1_i1.p1  ORF type:complete len:290 (+),score=34.39 TRINITY_DN6444_c0_g1_i1:59-871(+)
MVLKLARAWFVCSWLHVRSERVSEEDVLLLDALLWDTVDMNYSDVEPGPGAACYKDQSCDPGMRCNFHEIGPLATCCKNRASAANWMICSHIIQDLISSIAGSAIGVFACVPTATLIASTCGVLGGVATPIASGASFLTCGFVAGRICTSLSGKLAEAAFDKILSKEANTTDLIQQKNTELCNYIGYGPDACLPGHDAICSDYMMRVGCGWTNEYPCPGQPNIQGVKQWCAQDDGPDGEDQSLGWTCCCVQEKWKEDQRWNTGPLSGPTC